MDSLKYFEDPLDFEIMKADCNLKTDRNDIPFPIAPEKSGIQVIYFSYLKTYCGYFPH